ncbi:pyruvate dehydrogenase (acetyl-transferring) E1 component subunit alpha, partial [Coprothermobacter proteolyticus]|nr:pyruvate dehydrogenase (acetyl-transferring) E1 component subunit alpha [Coprothermobacter proteolyticus]
WYGHHAGAGADEQMGWIYRPEEEVEEWKKKDPVANFEKKLMAQGILTEEKKTQIWDKVNKQVEEAVEFAESSPFPDPSEAFTDVYTDLVLP